MLVLVVCSMGSNKAAVIDSLGVTSRYGNEASTL